MKLIHVSTPADSYREFTLTSSDALAVFPLEFVERELGVLRKGLRSTVEAQALGDVENEEWSEIILSFACSLGPTIEIGTVQEWGREATAGQRAALRAQIDRARRALTYAKKCVDEYGSATGALLPVTAQRRVEILLGHGSLPLAWARRLDLLSF